MKRSELARGAPSVARKGLAPGKGLSRTARKPREAAVSRQEPRRSPRVGNQVPQASRDALAARSEGRCEARVPGPCTGEATDWHHRQRRREGNHSPANGLHLCRHCHRKVHAHPELARSFGWLVSAWANPSEAPVLLGDGRWVLLGDTYTPCDDPTPTSEVSP